MYHIIFYDIHNLIGADNLITTYGGLSLLSLVFPRVILENFLCNKFIEFKHITNMNYKLIYTALDVYILIVFYFKLHLVSDFLSLKS